jgi:hypothetical protein
MSKLAKPPEARPLIKTPQELVHIKHKVSLRQYKYWLLMLRAYREAYELQGLPNEQGFYSIPISTLETWLGYELVRSELRADLEAIRREPIIYNVLGKDGKKILRGAGFISEWELTANWIGFKLPSFLRESIEQLDLKSSIFQKINWEVFNSFTGKYEAILYKLCRDYVGSKRTPQMSIQDYREYMGLKENEYAAFKDLNKFVISAPIKRINESPASDIIVEAIFPVKEGRRIAAVQFLVTPKQQTMLDLGDDPAFRFSRVTISLPQQKEYLATKAPAMIELSIQRANEYADEQEKQGKEVNLGGLYRKAITEDWGQEYQAKKEREEQKKAKEQKAAAKTVKEEVKNEQAELQEDYLRFRTSRRIKALTLEQKGEFVKQYAEESGMGLPKSFDASTGEVKESVERSRYSTWLRKHFRTDPIEEQDFQAWKKAKLANLTQ